MSKGMILAREILRCAQDDNPERERGGTVFPSRDDRRGVPGETSYGFYGRSPSWVEMNAERAASDSGCSAGNCSSQQKQPDM